MKIRVSITKEVHDMIIRLKYNERPEGDHLFPRFRQVDPKDPESDVIWLDYEELFREPIIVKEDSTDVPEEIMAFVPKWRDMARKIASDDTKPYWPVKYAQTDIWYRGIKYRVGTELIKDLAKANTQDWLYEMISYDVRDDVSTLDIDYITYHGMLD